MSQARIQRPSNVPWIIHSSKCCRCYLNIYSTESNNNGRNRPSTTDDLIFSCLSPASLVNYARMSKAAQGTVGAYIQRAFSLERVLERFFTPSETNYFRFLQSQTQMFISGSTALQFFERSSYPDSDLDIYVEHRFRQTVVAWLLQIGYQFKPRDIRSTSVPFSLEEEMAVTIEPYCTGGSPSAPFFVPKITGYFGRGVTNVYNFFKYNPERKIQLITSDHSPLEIVLNFHSSMIPPDLTKQALTPFFLSMCYESYYT